jgi:hypothetical protein
MADDGVWTRGDISGGDGFWNEDLSIDVETLLHILGEEDPQPLQVGFLWKIASRICEFKLGVLGKFNSMGRMVRSELVICVYNCILRLCDTVSVSVNWGRMRGEVLKAVDIPKLAS